MHRNYEHCKEEMMKQISAQLLLVLGICMLLFTACNNASDFTVKGVVSGADGQTMYLENVGISNVETLDSVKLTAAGKFKFNHKRPAYPDFYRLRLNNQRINLRSTRLRRSRLLPMQVHLLLHIPWKVLRIQKRSKQLPWRNWMLTRLSAGCVKNMKINI